jgi:hypothetical protein
MMMPRRTVLRFVLLALTGMLSGARLWRPMRGAPSGSLPQPDGLEVSGHSLAGGVRFTVVNRTETICHDLTVQPAGSRPVVLGDAPARTAVVFYSPFRPGRFSIGLGTRRSSGGVGSWCEITVPA